MIKLEDLRSKFRKVLADALDRAESGTTKLFRTARELLERLDAASTAKPADAK